MQKIKGRSSRVLQQEFPHLKKRGSCRQIGEAGVVLVYYDPFELTTFQQEYGDDPVSHQGFAE
jgi:REP element-mobilizing transposase RayT